MLLLPFPPHHQQQQGCRPLLLYLLLLVVCQRVMCDREGGAWGSCRQKYLGCLLPHRWYQPPPLLLLLLLLLLSQHLLLSHLVRS